MSILNVYTKIYKISYFCPFFIPVYVYIMYIHIIYKHHYYCVYTSYIFKLYIKGNQHEQ